MAVQFTPPAGVQPGMVGTILDEEVNLVDITSTLVDLAVRGHLQIARDDQGVFRADDWVLTRTAPPATASALAPYEQLLLDSIFVGGNRIALSQLKNHFKPTLDAVERLMYDEVVQRGWFRRSPERQRSGWVGLRHLRARRVGGLRLLRRRPARRRCTRTPGSRSTPPGCSPPAGWWPACSSACSASGWRRAPPRGRRSSPRHAGSSSYIATAEANQIRWEEAQDVFSRFLPYAIVFGLADRWARVFEEVAAAAAAAGHSLASPTWYVGSWSTGGFSDVASSMDSFSTVAAGTFVSTPGLLGVERVQRRRGLLRWRRRGLVGRQLVAARATPAAGAWPRGRVAHDEGPPPRCGSGPSWVRRSVLEGVLDLLAGLLEVGLDWSTRPSASRRSLSVALPAASLPLPATSSFMFSILSPRPMSLSFSRESEHRAVS